MAGSSLCGSVTAAAQWDRADTASLSPPRCETPGQAVCQAADRGIPAANLASERVTRSATRTKWGTSDTGRLQIVHGSKPRAEALTHWIPPRRSDATATDPGDSGLYRGRFRSLPDGRPAGSDVHR